MGSFAEQPSIRFYIGSIPKSVVDALSSRALGFALEVCQRACLIR